MTETVPSPDMPLGVQEILAVAQDQVAAEFPSAQGAVVAHEETAAFSRQMRNDMTLGPGETVAEAEEDGRRKVTSREVRRFTRGGTLGRATIDMILVGSHYGASFEPEMAETIVSDTVAEVLGPLQGRLGFITSALTTFTPHIQTMHRLAKSGAVEVAQMKQRGPAGSYRLARILATDVGTESWDDSKVGDWPPSHMLARLAILGGEDPGRSLGAEIRSGEFDSLIANDLLRGADTDRPLTPAMERIGRLLDFATELTASNPSDPNFHERVASLLEHWSGDTRAVVVNARELLLGGMMFNLKVAKQWLDRERFLAPNSKEDFEEVVRKYLGESVNTLQLNSLTPRERQAAMVAKMSAKRRGGALPGTAPSKRRGKQAGESAPAEVAPAEEVPAEPLKIVTCLQGGVTVEGAEAYVAAFTKKISQGSVVKEDLERVLAYMVRPESAELQRLGAKAMQDRMVPFGDNLYKLWEMKPTEATDLSLRTKAVKDARVYFIKLPDNTLGIVGIEPRDKQDEFTRNISVRGRRPGK